MLEVTLLGTGGMLPKNNRWLSSCLISCEGHSILIDCGEGTQIALKAAEKKPKPIDLICITHFHADHISGLPGFLLSMGNEGRTEPVTIAGPPGTEKVVQSLCIIAPKLPFPVIIKELSEPEIFRSGLLEVSFFSAEHTVKCIGYSFYLPRKGKFDPQKAIENNVPMEIWSELQKNGEAVYENNIYTYEMVGGDDRKGLKVSYCTDSRPCGSIISGAMGSDLLICEGLYYDPEKSRGAAEKGHMVFSEAASIAKDACVKCLWLTHYSPALKDPQSGIDEARKIFRESECGYDGKSITLKYENE